MTPEKSTSIPKAMPADPVGHLIRLLEGYTDHDANPPTRVRGLLERMEALEKAIAEQEDARQRAEAQRLTWKNGLALTAAGGVLSQALGWAKDHIK